MITIEDVDTMEAAEANMRRLQDAWLKGEALPDGEGDTLGALLNAKAKWEVLLESNVRDLMRLARAQLEQPKGIGAAIKIHQLKRAEQLNKEAQDSR